MVVYGKINMKGCCFIKTEVVNIMMTLFSDEYILKTYVESERREAAEKATRKLKQEAVEEAFEKARKSAQKMFRKGSTIEDIADVLDVSLEEVEQWLELAKA